MDIAVERDGPLFFVRLSRPAKRNALSDRLVRAIEEVFAELPADAGAVVLHGEGAHFSAGLDLAELAEGDAAEGVMHSRWWHKVLDTIQFGPVPVIAALHGAVIGGGLEFASACHIRVAEPSAFYALPEGERGIFVGGSGSVRIPRLIGTALMMDMMMTGRVIGAAEGHPLGFSQYLVGEGEALARATELARKVAGNARFTNYALMQVLPRIGEAGFEAGLMMEALAAGIAQSTPEAKQRMRDFLEKRAGKVGRGSGEAA